MSEMDNSVGSSGMPAQKRMTVALGVTGSIAAFKSIEIARLLIQDGVRVLPVLTNSGAKFVGPVTFAGVCGEPARMDMWDGGSPGELHLHLAREADVVLIAPATADILSRIAMGRADDLLTALVLCSRGRVVVAPAMHPRMWAHPATQRNVETIARDGRVEMVGPVVGQVANGEVGLGRMADPREIVDAVLLGGVAGNAGGNRAGLSGGVQQVCQDLAGKQLVVTAGPTVEDIDPVRFLSNRSSGRMGFSIARRAALRGASVTLIAGPTDLATPAGVTRVDVRSALDMREAVGSELYGTSQSPDALVMAAAVGDYRAAVRHETKIKRGEGSVTLELVQNPDILADVGRVRLGQSVEGLETSGNSKWLGFGSSVGRPTVLVGFALETDDGDALVERARGKLDSKFVDLVVGNAASDGFGGDMNRAVLVSREGVVWCPLMVKDGLADRILDYVRERLM